jgi:endo-1,4-beta-xylanase
MVNLVQELQSQGVPIHGIGMQMHVNIFVPSAAEVEQSIEAFAELGRVRITEMDMSLYNNDNDSYDSVPKDALVEQGYRYKDLFEVFTRQADNIDIVTFWGMADDHTWLKTWPTVRLNLPLLFDEQLQAKAAFWGIIDPTQLPVLIKKISIAEGTPEIDGQTETLWATQAWQLLTPDISFQTRWDENNLYVIIRTEGTENEVGLIEIFIDEGNDKTGAYDQYIVFTEGVCTDCADITFATFADETTSYLEAAISLGTSVGIRDELGFDLRITVAGSAEPISWNDKTHSQDTDTANYGTLRLTDAAKMTFAIQGTPIIDADEDEIWANATTETTAVWVLGSSGSTAEVKTMWDEENLYLYVVVTDVLLSKASRNVYEHDSFELYIDQNNGKTTSYEPDDGQYRINFDNELSFGGFGSEDRITSATKVTETGYIVELAIKLDAITPEPGMIIGYDFQVNNDENGNGSRDSVVTWNDPTHQTYLNLSRTGLLMFME